jgi:hypothetical protein
MPARIAVWSDGQDSGLAEEEEWDYSQDMPERSRKRPSDLNRLAADIVGEATGDEQPAADVPEKDPAAVALGRKGGLKGGRARADKLTPEQRSEIAKKAADARWHKQEKKA